MKLILVILLAISSVYSKTIIITDIDDTLKITRLKKLEQLPAAAFDTEKYFKGMPALLNTIPNDGVFYVSNGFHTPFLKTYKKFLSRHQFPQGELYLRKFKNLSDHKIKTITKILESQKPEKVIFIGDNGQEDPNIYNEISEKFSSIQFTTFIRTLYGPKKATEIHSEQIGFITPFEIVDHLFSLDYMSLQKSTLFIVNNTLNFLTELSISQSNAKWIPSWVDCSLITFDKPELELRGALFAIYKKIENRCF